MPTLLSRKTVHLTEEHSKIVDDFMDKFPTEEDCIEEICKTTAPQNCVHCGYDELERSFGSRVSYCKKCRGKIYCTSQSFFHRIKKIHAMMACIYFFQEGFCIPSIKLSEIFGITIATAQKIIKKISHVLKEQMSVELPQTASSNFLVLFGKRSSETPARKHPRHEQKVLEEEQKDRREQNPNSQESNSQESNSSDAPNQTHSFIEDKDTSVLSFIQDEPVSFDELAALSGKSARELGSLLSLLEIEGIIKRLPGDKYVRFKPDENELVFINITQDFGENKDQLGSIIQFIQANFGSCSRKYLNLFLAMHWCHRDRARWSNGQLLKACLDYGYISFSSIYASVTPLITHFCPF